MPDAVLPSEGTLRVAVLFVDFVDGAANYPTLQEAEMGLPFMEEALEASSYGRLDVEFVPLHRWLRAEHSHSHYLEDSYGAEAISADIDAEAVRLADPYFAFDGIDSLMVVMPSAYFFGGTATGSVTTDEGVVTSTLRVNAFPHDGVEGAFPWGWIAIHEFMHNLGLVDMYSYATVGVPEPPDGEEWTSATFGFMGLSAFYSLPTSDPRLTHVVRHPDGSSSTEYARNSTASEMLAWSRWQLGWLDEDQVLCISDQHASFKLAPVADPGERIAMAAIPLSGHEVIVLESRRQIGFDVAYEEPLPDGGHTVLPALLTEGVLVYTVDALISSGDIPIRLLDDTGYLVVSDYPILAVGDRATVRGYTITVVADDGDTHTVTIAKTGGG